MKHASFLTSLLIALNAVGCAAQKSRSALQDASVDGAAAQSAGASALLPSTEHLGRIQAIDAAAPANGQIVVTVTYLRSCDERFETLMKTQGRPISLANPHVVVGVVMSRNGIACEAADVVETQTFPVNNVVGAYTFEPMSPDAQLNTYHPASITGIQLSGDPSTQIAASVTYEQACGDELVGLLHANVSPISLANPHQAVLALMKSTGVLCETDTVPATQTFPLPALTGVYSLMAIQPAAKN